MLRWRPEAQGGIMRWQAPGGCTTLAASSLRGLLAVVCANSVYVLDSTSERRGS